MTNLGIKVGNGVVLLTVTNVNSELGLCIVRPLPVIPLNLGIGIFNQLVRLGSQRGEILTDIVIVLVLITLQLAVSIVQFRIKRSIIVVPLDAVAGESQREVQWEDVDAVEEFLANGGTCWVGDDFGDFFVEVFVGLDASAIF